MLLAGRARQRPLAAPVGRGSGVIQPLNPLYMHAGASQTCLINCWCHCTAVVPLALPHVSFD
jgi:hypothetical protein